jgi:hypothetical protein
VTGALLSWVAIFTLTLTLGATLQWFIFGIDQTGFSFLLRWPILWLIYFFVAHAIVENVTAHLERKKRGK